MTKKTKKAPIDEVRSLALTPQETLSIGKALAEMRAATAEHTLLLHERAILLSKIDPEGALKRLNAQLAEKKNELEGARQLHAQVVSGIEKRLAVNLAEYSFDDVAGTLHHLGPTTKE